jgi:hypothetical protein
MEIRKTLRNLLILTLRNLSSIIEVEEKAMPTINGVWIFRFPPDSNEWYVEIGYSNFRWKISNPQELRKVLEEARKVLLEEIGKDIPFDESAFVYALISQHFAVSGYSYEKKQVQRWIRQAVMPFDFDPEKYFRFLEDREWEEWHRIGMMYHSPNENRKRSHVVTVDQATKKKIEKEFPKICKKLTQLLLKHHHIILFSPFKK